MKRYKTDIVSLTKINKNVNANVMIKWSILLRKSNESTVEIPSLNG